MAFASPETSAETFEKAYNAGDMDALLDLYEPGATLIATPGQPSEGIDAIRATLVAFLAMKGTMRLTKDSVYTAGDIALHAGSWTLKAKNEDGSPLELSGKTAEVMRRQADGTWRYIVDNAVYGE